MRLQERVMIVTGGASGIGKAIAVRAASEGAKVVIADIREGPVEGGEAAVDLIKNSGGDASFKFCDVSNWAEVDALVQDTVDTRGTLDVMVNNAAAHGRSALLETTEEEGCGRSRAVACDSELTGMINVRIKSSDIACVCAQVHTYALACSHVRTHSMYFEAFAGHHENK